MDATNRAIWRRKGDEAEGEDRVEGRAPRGSDLTDRELSDHLANYFVGDLEALPEEERNEAVDELLAGYREGG